MAKLEDLWQYIHDAEKLSSDGPFRLIKEDLTDLWKYMHKAEKLLSDGGDKAGAAKIYAKALEKFDDSVSPGIIGVLVATRLGDTVWALEILEKWYINMLKIVDTGMHFGFDFPSVLNDMEKAQVIYADLTGRILEPRFFAYAAGGFARILKDDLSAIKMYIEAMLRGRRLGKGVFDAIFISMAEDLADKKFARKTVKDWIKYVSPHDNVNTVLEAVDKLDYDLDGRKEIYNILIEKAKKFPSRRGLDTIQEWFKKQEDRNGI